MKQYQQLPTTVTDPATGLTETYMLDVPLEFRQGAARTGDKGKRCYVCGSVYGQREGVTKNGRFYCYKNGCFNDVVGDQQ